MIAALLFAIGAPAVAELTLDERTPAVLLLSTPKDAAPSAPTSAYLEALAAALRARTHYALLSPEQAGLDRDPLLDCARERRLTCFTLAVHNASPSAAAIFVLGVLPLDRAQDRLSLAVIDVARARAIEADDTGGADEREDAIYAGARRTEPKTVRAADRASLAAWAVAAIAETVEPSPLGAIAIANTLAGAELRVDGVLLGSAGAPSTMLLDVRPGVRKISMAGAELSIAVEPGKTANAAFPVELGRVAPDFGRHRLIFWTGGGVAVLGGALAIYSAVRGGAIEARCVGSSAEARCEAAGFPTFALDTGALPSSDRDAVNGGPPILPLALGLLAAGGTAALSAHLSEDPEAWWLPLLLGAAAGGAAFTATLLADPR